MSVVFECVVGDGREKPYGDGMWMPWVTACGRKCA